MKSSAETIRRQIVALGANSVSSQHYRVALLSLLRQAIPFDAACCTHVDPHTLLSTGAITEDRIEPIHQELLQSDYDDEDYNAYHELVRKAVPVAILSEATQGCPERSPRYRHALQPTGFVDEMRSALMAGGKCWGYLTLFRGRDQPWFQAEERGFLASVVPFIGTYMRSCSLALPAEDRAWDAEDEPGIAVLSGQLELLSSNSVADRWLTQLRAAEQIGELVLPRPVRAVCTRALHDGSNGAAPADRAKACIRLPEGPYLTLRASRLSGSAAPIRLAVWFEAARPSDMLPLIADAYQLTERELQLLEGIFRGRSTKQLARSLYISTYTVQDHVKSIFSKTGVSSRRELIWRLHARYSLPVGR